MKIDLSKHEIAALRNAYAKWGADKQIGMAMEECAETIVALNHFSRGRGKARDVLNEFADAFVCVAQVLESVDALQFLEEAIENALNKLQLKLAHGNHNHREEAKMSIHSSEPGFDPNDKLDPKISLHTGWVISEVVSERQRQISEEGFSVEGDDLYTGGELARAGASYALGTLDHWPWTREWWKPKTRRHNLIRAIALLIAEVERLDRAG